MNRYGAGRQRHSDDDDDDSLSDEEQGWYDNTLGYDSDEDEDEEYDEFVEREFGDPQGRSRRLTPFYFWTAVVLIFSLCFPFLLMLLQAIAG